MATRKTSAKDTATFTCPECGREFSRAAALGAHRRQAHGVVGTSKQKLAGSSNASQSRRTSRRGASSTSRVNVNNARPTPSSPAGFDRDQLLGVLFPNGIPARSETLRAVNAWLDEGERLAKAR